MGKFCAQECLIFLPPKLHWPELGPSLTARESGTCEQITNSTTEIKRCEDRNENVHSLINLAEVKGIQGYPGESI